MKVSTVKGVLVIVFLSLFSAARSPLSAQQQRLTPEQRNEFLSERTERIIPGSFDSVCSYLYAVHSVSIHTDSRKINASRITPTFPPFYKPTWEEVFNLIGVQTRSAWNYDPDTGFWSFHEEDIGLPYIIKPAAGWQKRESPFVINYIPPKLAPVGMDIYWLGSYSVDDGSETSIIDRVRDSQAMQLIRGNIKDASPEKMTKVNIGRAEALYFQALTDAGVVWRQWMIIDKGQAFLIVSAIKPEHEKELLPDVLAMVESFEATAPSSLR